MSTDPLSATRAQLAAIRELGISFDLNDPPTFDEAARLLRLHAAGHGLPSARTLSVEGVKAHLAEQPITIESLSTDLNLSAGASWTPGSAQRLGHITAEPCSFPAHMKVGHCPGTPCAVCGRVELPGGTIAVPGVLPLCGVHFAEWKSTAAMITNVAPGTVIRAEPLAPEIGFHFGEHDAAGVAMSPDCTHMVTRGSLVATLPDGTRINLPAGTTLRAGNDPHAVTDVDDFFDDVLALIPRDPAKVYDRREVLEIIANAFGTAGPSVTDPRPRRRPK